MRNYLKQARQMRHIEPGLIPVIKPGFISIIKPGLICIFKPGSIQSFERTGSMYDTKPGLIPEIEPCKQLTDRTLT